MLIDLLKYTEIKEYDIALCKPNREVIGYLPHKGLKIKGKLKEENEVEFEVPKYINNDYGMMIENHLYNNVLGDYLLFVDNEYYVIDKCSENTKNLSKTVHAFSYEKVLEGYRLRVFQGTRRLYNPNATEDTEDKERGILNLFEKETFWKVGHVDESIQYDSENLLKYRFFDIAEISWLGFLKESICDTFNCIIIFDTVNRLINLYDKDTYGENKGLYISEDNYLTDLIKEVKYENIVTRLRAYGKNNISITGFNPTGSEGIEDYSFYKNEKYMSIEMINKLNAYESQISSKENGLKDYLNQINAKQKIILQKEEELTGLKLQQSSKQQAMDIANSEGNTSLYNTLKSQFDDIEANITSKENEIETLNNEIDMVKNNISTIRQNLNKSNFFTDEELETLENLTKEETWSDETYTDSRELYEEAKKRIKERNIPPVGISSEIMSFLDNLEHAHDWDKLILGDIATVDSKRLNTIEDVRIIEYTHDVDNKKLDLELSNKYERKDNVNSMANMMSNSNRFATTGSIYKHNWNLAGDNRSEIEKLVYGSLDTSRNRVISEKGKTIIDEHGITATSLLDNNRKLRIVGDLIAFTDDNFNTVKTAIDSNGVHGEHIVANSIKAHSIDLDQLKVGGNIQLAPGAVIGWGSINKDGTFNNDVVTITKDTVDAPYLKTLNLTVGNEIKMGANATIEWGNVNSKPTIPTQYTDDMALTTWQNTYIDGNSVFTGYVDADLIYGDWIVGKRIQTDNNNGNTVKLENQWIDVYQNSIRRLTIGALKLAGDEANVIPCLAFGDLPKTDNMDVLNEASADYGIMYRDVGTGRWHINNQNGIRFYIGNQAVILGSDKISLNGNIDFSSATVSGLNVVAKFA